MGSIFYDKKKGLYRLIFTDSKRSPKQKTIYLPADRFSRRQAKKVLSTLEFQYSIGQFDPWTDKQEASITRESLQSQLDEYLEVRQKTVSETTFDLEKGVLARIYREYPINHFFTDKRLASEFINSAPSFSTKKRYHTILSAIFNYLYHKSVIDFTLADVQILGTSKDKVFKPFGYLTSQEFTTFYKCLVQHLTDVTNNPMANSMQSKMYIDIRPIVPLAFEVCFYLGLRRSEIRQFNTDLLSEDLKYYYINKGDFIDKSATDSNTPIPLPVELHPILCELRAMANNKPFERISLDYFTKTFKKVVEKALPHRADDVSFHSLRHSCAMYWLWERKKRIELVQKIMRHSSIQTTEIYLKHRPINLYEEMNNDG